MDTGKQQILTSLINFFQVTITLTWIRIWLCNAADQLQLCPEFCVCSVLGSDGIFVDCSDNKLSEIPHEYPKETSKISFNSNSLQHVDLSVFPELLNLRRLTFLNCHIKQFGFGEENSDQDTQFSSNLPNLESLELMHNELQLVPINLPLTIQILHLGSNAIDSLDGDKLILMNSLRELFLDNNLISWLDWHSFHNSSYAPMEENEADIQTGVVLSKLEKLALNANRISSISQSAFAGMTSLTALTLAKNKLTSLNEKTFKDLQRLQHLDLSYNRIMDIPPLTFDGVRFLKYLSLNHNRIQDVPTRLPMLEWLDLSHNRIANVSEDLKSVIFPAEVFNFAHNPLHCDCKLRWLKELYDRREYLIKHIDIAAEDFVPTCVSPRRVAGETWDNLSDDVFNCVKDADDPTVYEDPLQPRSKNQMDRLLIRSGAVKDTSIQVFWNHQPPVSYSNVYVQSYVFGLRSTTVKHVELSAAQQEFTLRHLRPLTNYVVCVIPKLSDSEENVQPRSVEHCLEVQTKALQEQVGEVSFMSMASWYILGMLGTIIMIFSCVGGIALIYGLYSSKTDWSAKYAQEIQVDAPLDESGDFPTTHGPDPSVPSNKDKTD